LYNIAVLLSGSGTNLQAVIDAVENGEIKNAKVALVLSSRDTVYGLQRAEKHGIPNMAIDRNDSAGLLKTLEDYNINGIVLAGYLTILSPDVIKKYGGSIINIHPALLPLFGGKGFYGIKVHQAVLASGVKYTGATAHIVDYGVDTGAALVREVIPTLSDDTAESLQKRVLAIEHNVLILAVKALVEGRVNELAKNPILLVNDNNREGIFEYAKGLLELGSVLTAADSEGL